MRGELHRVIEFRSENRELPACRPDLEFAIPDGRNMQNQRLEAGPQLDRLDNAIAAAVERFREAQKGGEDAHRVA